MKWRGLSLLFSVPLVTGCSHAETKQAETATKVEAAFQLVVVGPAHNTYLSPSRSFKVSVPKNWIFEDKGHSWIAQPSGNGSETLQIQLFEEKTGPGDTRTSVKPLERRTGADDCYKAAVTSPYLISCGGTVDGTYLMFVKSCGNFQIRANHYDPSYVNSNQSYSLDSFREGDIRTVIKSISCTEKN